MKTFKTKKIKMKKKLYSAAVILLFGIGISAQKTNSVKQEIKKDAKTVGKAAKDGAEWTGKTAKKGANAVDKTYQNTKADIKKD